MVDDLPLLHLLVAESIAVLLATASSGVRLRLVLAGTTFVVPSSDILPLTN